MATTHYCARCLTTFQGDSGHCPNLACGRTRPEAGWGVLLGAGDLLDRRYRIIRPLAVGGAGLTYLAREVGDDGEPMPPDLAIKVLYTQRDSGPFLRRLSNEAQILQELDHENIVTCRGFVHRTGHAPYLVTRFEHGGSLAAHVEHHQSLPAGVAADVLRQILRALDVAHQHGVVHRDMKPENVLLAEPVPRDQVPHVRLTDFGIAKVFGGFGSRLTKLGAFVGTPEYAAPEQFEGMAPTPATDVFAVGGVLYFLLVGQPPVRFSQRMDIETSLAELLEQVPPRLPEGLEEPLDVARLQEVLDHTMVVEPGDRWTAHQVIARLNVMVDGLVQAEPGTLELTDQGLLAPDVIEDTDLPPPQRRTPPPAPAAASPTLAPSSLPPGAPPPDEPAPPSPPEPPVVDDPSPPPVPSPPHPPVEPPTQPTPAPDPPKPPAEPPIEPSSPPEPPVEPDPPPPPPAEPPPPPTQSHLSPASPEPTRSGLGKVVAALGGAVVLLSVGGVLVVVVLVVAAWALGWFGPPSVSTPTPLPVPIAVTPTEPVVLEPVVVERREPTRLTGALGRDRIASRRSLVQALSSAAPELARRCSVDDVAAMTVVVDGDGAIRSVAVDQGALVPERARCVEQAVASLVLPVELGEPALVRVSLALFP